MDERRLVFVRTALAAVPKNGRVICDAWWIVCPARGLVFLRAGARALTPQCNAHRRIVEALQAGLYRGFRVQYVPVVFVAHADAAIQAEIIAQRSAGEART